MSFEIVSIYHGKPRFKWVGDDPKTGQIAQLAVFENEIVAKLSNGHAPLGIITKYIQEQKASYIEVEEKRGFYKTDCYDPEQRYPVNTILFVKNGLLTPVQDDEKCPGVAFVVNPPTAFDHKLTFIWM